MNKTELKRREAQVIEDYDGVLPMYFAFYDRSVLYCAEKALAAFNEFSKNGWDDSTVFANLQDALSHSAGLSRFFFPKTARNNPLADARRASLRIRYEVAETSSLSQLSLRNALQLLIVTEN